MFGFGRGDDVVFCHVELLMRRCGIVIRKECKGCSCPDDGSLGFY